jgi:hypothetical protein
VANINDMIDKIQSKAKKPIPKMETLRPDQLYQQKYKSEKSNEIKTEDTGENQPCPKPPVSEINPGENHQGKEESTLVKTDTVENQQCGKSSGLEEILTPQRDFTGIPNCLLRDRENRPTFEQPIDFQIYCHMLSYSYGNDRNECDLGQDKLIKLTNSARQRVKASLDRLAKDGWIKCIKQFSAARESRRWRVFTPFELGKTDHETYLPKLVNTGENQHCRKSTVSKTDSVQGRKSPGSNEGTLVKINTYQYSTSNTHSQDTHSQAIEAYLNKLSKAVQKSERHFANQLIEEFGVERIHEGIKLVVFDDKGIAITKKMAWLIKGGMDKHKSEIEAIITRRKQNGDQPKTYTVPELSPEEEAKSAKAREEAMAKYRKKKTNTTDT